MKESFLSAGVDIGTSTTQLVFSKICIENTAALAAVPRIQIVDREVVYKSRIHFTPLIYSREGNPDTIDQDRIREIVLGEYERAGVVPEEVGTGAVIITGETAGKTNAAKVLGGVSSLAGGFVVATAGPALEGIIAGKGANAHTLSRKTGAVVANFDMGGGTTNIALFKDGEVIETCCLNIGGRLVTFQDDKGTLAHVSPKIKAFAQGLGMDLTVGDILPQTEIEVLARAMAQVLVQAAGLAEKDALFPAMVTDQALSLDAPIEIVTFSGGVADCMNPTGQPPFQYKDMGWFLGRAVAQSDLVRKLEVHPAAQTIRATVVGAGCHTTRLSGSTIFYDEKVLPLQNLPVLKLSCQEEALAPTDLGACIRNKLAWFDLPGEKQMPALAFAGPEAPGFDDIQDLAQSILWGMAPLMHLDAPLVVVVEKDFSKALGQALAVRLKGKKEVVCIDSIKVENSDYIDIGKGLAQGRVVPVVVKTLVFESPD